MGTRGGGRRPEGGNKKPAFIPLGGFHYHDDATQKEKRRDVACNVSKNKKPVVIPLGGRP